MKTGGEPGKCHCSLSDPSPTYSATTQPFGLPHPGKYLRVHPLQHNRPQRERNMAQMKEQIKAPKMELSNEEIANESDAEFKTLVIRMPTKWLSVVTKQRKN